MKPFSHEILMHLGMRGYVKKVWHQCDTPSFQIIFNRLFEFTGTSTKVDVGFLS